ncbi:hypothetical protein AC579_1679 [Pseudocercospora musae]|uniref:Uncharacterized protein n=1 Tax=Pseudocercospora musae TaxID=113226 RepID=A0A139I9B3_9PEZI|nr:hypothetical protein AC579_1679 [Pseudocercospora musae]
MTMTLGVGTAAHTRPRRFHLEGSNPARRGAGFPKHYDDAASRTGAITPGWLIGGLGKASSDHGPDRESDQLTEAKQSCLKHCSSSQALPRGAAHGLMFAGRRRDGPLPIAHIYPHRRNIVPAAQRNSRQ